MWRTYLATALNFFFPGLGTLSLGHNPVRSVLWLIGVIGLTYVELSLQALSPSLYGVMFASVFIMNTAFAIEAYQVGRAKFGAGEPATA